MIIFRKAADLSAHVLQTRKNGHKIAMIPTMGALHEGHLTLIAEGRKTGARTLCSIFVNPTQFNDPADFQKYPVTTDQDILLLEKAGTDYLFLPTVAGMYPQGTGALEQYALGPIEHVLEGKFRPGHFQGVCQVMHRLLSAAMPDFLLMGQKDFQQCLVVQKLLQLMHMSLTFIAVPTVRESDGLAMSSRNRRLSPAQRAQAPAIFQTLTFLKNNLATGDLKPILDQATDQLRSAGFTIDYVSIARRDSLELLDHWDGQSPLVALIAAFLEPVRLIDNLFIG